MAELSNTERLLKKRQFIEWDQINAEQKMAQIKQKTFFTRLRKKLTTGLTPLFQSHQEN